MGKWEGLVWSLVSDLVDAPTEEARGKLSISEEAQMGQLESRTKQVIDLLSNAAMARCGMHEESIGEEVPSRAERKLKESINCGRRFD